MTAALTGRRNNNSTSWATVGMSANMFDHGFDKRRAKKLGTVTVIWLTYCTSAVLGMCTDSWCVNGRCRQPPAPPGCECNSGFYGFYCETRDERQGCVQSDCLNNGICLAAPPPAPQACECPPEYVGYFCETRVCTGDNDCHGGRCMVKQPPERSVCVDCMPGTAGPLCEYPFGELCGATDGLCLNDGDCVPRPSTAGFICMCTAAYIGPVCGRSVLNCSVTRPCRNEGTCVNGACECLEGVTGPLCEIACNSDDDCENGGTCMADGSRCLCADGFEGPRCSLGLCIQKSDCLNGGSCVEDVCQCAPGYGGSFCEEGPCIQKSDCLNGGSCMEGVCQCSPGYGGSFCEEGFCDQRSDCLNEGKCLEDVCECAPGFDGPFCEIACMQDSDCRNGGTCSSDGTCDCIDNFTGPKCQDDPVATLSIAVIVVSVVSALLLLILVIVLVVLLRKRLAKRNDRDRRENGQLELGTQNKRTKSNEYIGVRRDAPPAVSKRPGSTFEPGNKEFPRENLHVMELLGSGSFATVHRAEAEGIIRKGVVTTVAVKMLKSTATDGDKSDFEKERNMYLSLGTHPNVVTMLGYCTEKEPFFLIMEYLPNGNLQTYLRHIRTGSKNQYFDLKEDKERDFLTPSEILSFASQIANGMDFLSSKSCIHRDLATRNILLGPDLEAKVSDFGLARDVQDSSQYEMKSRGRVPVRWMAPESLLDNIYTTKSDVWSFAVLLWELITLGSHPYPGMSSKQVIDEVKAGYRLPKPESCSDEIYDMMKRCWNLDPGNRPSFGEICKLLDTMMADANGYLIMADLNKDEYLYLEPSQTTKSIDTADDY